VGVYTTQVRSICESLCDLDESVGYKSINNVIKESQEKIFDFDYPIFDESYRSVLQSKILKHYYTREICEETVGLWKLRLDSRLNDIMPYYNQLYKSELLTFNPLYDVELKTTHKRTGNNNEKATQNDVTTRMDSETIKNTESRKNTTTENLQTTDSNTIDTNNKTKENKQLDVESTTELNNTSTETGESKTEDKTKGENYNLESDTPMNGLKGVDNETYLSKVEKNNNESTVTSTGELENKKTDKSTTENQGKETQANEITLTGKINDVTLIQANNNITDTANNTVDTTRNQTGENKNQSNIIKDMSSLEDYEQLVLGKTSGQTYSTMLKEFRETFLNIDKMVIEELKDLFFNLWKVEGDVYGFYY
jgi:hypothetical protein